MAWTEMSPPLIIQIKPFIHSSTYGSHTFLCFSTLTNLLHVAQPIISNNSENKLKLTVANCELISLTLEILNV